MSQRVQKGNTVFRPVARPRARVGTESRQASVLPESAPGAGPSRLQDNSVQRATSVILPPTAPSPRIPAESTGSGDNPSAFALGPPLNDSIPMHHPFPQANRSHHSAPVVHAAPLRMPPMIGSSQQLTSHNSTPISAPSQPTVHISLSPGVTDPLVASAGAHLFSDFVPVPSHIPGMHDPFAALPFPIDALQQIDPQLMGPPRAPGFPTFGLQEIPLHDPVLDNGSSVSFSEAPAIKPSRPRRSSRKKSGPNAVPTELTTDQESEHSSMTPGKRKRSKKQHTGGDENTAKLTSKRRRSSGSGRSRTRPPSSPPFNLDADPGEELDPTVVTMAALCDDTGRGRVSSRAALIVSNHAAWRAANREKRARMRTVMEAKKYGRNLEEEEGIQNVTASQPEINASGTRVEALEKVSHTLFTGDDDAADQDADGFDYGENLTVSQYNPQVRIGANGETILDEDSLFVNRNEEHHTEDYTHVEESDFTKFVNSATYSKKGRGSRWSAEETELFYEALSQFGENYELISYLLPGRDRKACKNKFKTEDKKDPVRITYCLNNRRPYDIATLSRMTGKDFSGPTPEIRAPTPQRSTELQTTTDPAPSSSSGRTARKKSKTPSVRDMDVEVVGHIDDVEQEDIIGNT